MTKSPRSIIGLERETRRLNLVHGRKGRHPEQGRMHASAKYRTELPERSCWHCLQDFEFVGGVVPRNCLAAALIARRRIGDGGAETAEIAETLLAVHPVGETAKIRTGLAVSCWHCRQNLNYCRNGAQKYQMWRQTPEAPQAPIGVSLAEIASMSSRK